MEQNINETTTRNALYARSLANCPVIVGPKSRMAASNNRYGGSSTIKTNGVAAGEPNAGRRSDTKKSCDFLALLTEIINDADKDDGLGAMELICSQCDVIFECKVCRGLFRDFEQFSRHKSSLCPAKVSDPHANDQSPNNAELNLNKESILALHDQYTTARVNRVAEVTESYERPRKSSINPARAVYYSQKRNAKALKEVQNAAANSNNLVNSPSKAESIQSDVKNSSNLAKNDQVSASKTSRSLATCPVCNKSISNNSNLRRHLMDTHKIPLSEIENRNLIPWTRNHLNGKSPTNSSTNQNSPTTPKINQDSQSSNNLSANEENISYSGKVSNNTRDVSKNRDKVNFKRHFAKSDKELVLSHDSRDALRQTVSFNHPAIRTREHDYFQVKFSTNFNVNKTKHASISKTKKLSAKIMSVALRDHFL